MYINSSLNRDLAALASGMGHPTRVYIIRRLAQEGPLPVHVLVSGQNSAQATVSRHLALLKNAGLVHTVAKGREVHYALETPALRRLASLVASIAAGR